MTDTAQSAARPAGKRLAQGLRDLRTRTGLSLTALADRTPYSRSSWERYLNGKQLAPRQAVEALCTMAGEPPGRLVALWELAELEWSGRHRTAPPAPPHDDPPGPRTPPAAAPVTGGSTGRRPRWVLVAAVCAVALAAAVGVTASLSAGAEDTGGTTKQAAPTAPPAPACRKAECAGEDPEMMGCAAPGQVRTLGSRQRTSTGAGVSLSFSTRCHTVWALLWNAQVGDALEVSVPGGRPQRIKVADRYDAESSLTPMVYGTDLTGLQACFAPAGGGRTECYRPRFNAPQDG